MHTQYVGVYGYSNKVYNVFSNIWSHSVSGDFFLYSFQKHSLHFCSSFRLFVCLSFENENDFDFHVEK